MSVVKPRALLTKREAADALAVSVRTVESYIQQGLLVGVEQFFKGRRKRTMVRGSSVLRFKQQHGEGV